MLDGTGAPADDGLTFAERLARTPPGAALAALLATVDPARLHGFELVDVLDARNRQICFEQAHLLAAVRELAYAARTVATGEPIRDLTQNPWGGTEIAFALTYTEYAAETLIDIALSTVDKTPAVLTAMHSGQVDLPKAKVIAVELADASPELARRIVERLAPDLATCTTAQLRERIRRLLATLDPAAVRERERKAVENRGVQHEEFANGTSSLTGVYLPKDKAAAAWDNVDALARATRAAGDPLGRTIDQLRADVFADLLAGVDPTLPAAEGGAGAATPGRRRGTIHLHVGVTTLACLDDNPGLIEGFGTITAQMARETVAQLSDAAARERPRWRFTVESDAGFTLAEGRLTARPDPNWIRYRPSQAQRAFVNARDRTCRAPGCRRPAIACERDHRLDWLYSRDTSVLNLCCLCKRHHRAKHQGRFRIRRGVHGLDWITPLDRRYTVLVDDTPTPSPAEHDFAQHFHSGRSPSRLRR